jgi:hypothetical protein
MIKCVRCSLRLTSENFYMNGRRKGQRQRVCKSCHRFSQRPQVSRTPAYKLFTAALVRARRLNLTFTIKLEDVVIPDVCPVFGFPLVVGSGYRTSQSPTIDRIDSTKGYTPNNIAVISWRANDLKRDASLVELLKLRDWMRQRLSV